MNQTTRKRQKFIGATTVTLPGGEVIPAQVTQIEERDFNFHKIWLKNFLQSIDDIANQKLRLAFWIIDNLDSENKLVMTQRVIAEKSGMSLGTVIRTMRALQEGSPAFLQKINSGAYRVNPEVVWKGSYGSRMAVVYDYDTNGSESEGEQEDADEAVPDIRAVI